MDISRGKNRFVSKVKTFKNLNVLSLRIMYLYVQWSSQNTPLLDEEIAERIHRLELTGNPSASLPEELVNFPHSPEAVELCFDSNLRVTLQKVWKPLELVLVIYLTNQNQANAPIHDVNSVLEPPSNLIASFDSSTSNKLQDESIGPLEWVRISSLSNSFLFLLFHLVLLIIICFLNSF